MSIDVPPSSEVADSSAPAEPTLTPVLSSRWALKPIHLAVVTAFCLVFVVLNHLPLRGTDLWGHVVFGNAILDAHAIPTIDPLLPLAEGMRVVDVHWLSQTIFAAVDRVAGPEGLIGLFTVVVGLSYLFLGRTMFLLTQSRVLTIGLTAAVMLVGWSRVGTIRPENFAFLLFSILFWLETRRRIRRDESVLADDARGDLTMWLALPVMACLWANLHGSFPVMIATLGCFFVGRVLEVAWHERNAEAVLLDREARRRLYWLELSAAATLVNPYGIDAWIEAVRFSSNPNLRDILEWNPLILLGPGGFEFAIACLAMAFVWRHSRKPVAPADVLLLGVFGLLAVLQIRMAGWFALVWGVTFAPHAADCVAQWLPRRDEANADDAVDLDAPAPDATSYRYTIGCLGMIWIAFAFTTFSRPILGSAPRKVEQLYGDAMPLRATEWLRTSPAEGQVFNPQYWGDWLGRNFPEMKLFATTNVHLMPRSAWNDYQRIFRADNGWSETLERYAVRTIIVDRKEQAALVRGMKSLADWKIVYEDDQTLIYRKQPPQPNKPAAAAESHNCGAECPAAAKP
jgi:hypothetical protein